MTRIWDEAFWKPAPDTTVMSVPVSGRRSLRLAAWLGPVVVLALLTVIIGLAAEPVLALSLRAADQLANPARYVQAVLGG